MALKKIQPFRKTDNASILNAIRADSSAAYQQRVPAATKANITASVENIMDYRVIYNEFVDALVNQIGRILIRNISWTNPLGKFKMGMLPFGSTVEEVGVGLATAYVYDTNRDYLEKDIFGQERPEVQSSFHSINRQEFYKITVNRDMLKRAFQSEEGLYDLINELLAVPAKSDEFDEYLIMRELFAEYDRNNGFFKVNIPDVEQGDAADAKAALRIVRATAGKLTFISRNYNAAALPVAAKTEQLELFATPEFMAAVDVEALAAAFNTEYTNIPMRITLMDEIPIEGVQAILSTADLFVVMDTLLETTTAENPVGLHTNYFLHHHGIYSMSRFVPAIAFTTGAGTVIPVIDTPVTDVADIQIRSAITTELVTKVTRGQMFEVFSEAITTGVNKAVTYRITGQDASNRSFIDQNGTLYVYPGENAVTLNITVEATDANNDQFMKSATVNVVGTKIGQWPVAPPSPDVDEDRLFETAVPAAVVKTGSGGTAKAVVPAYNINTDHFKYQRSGVDIAPGEYALSASTAFTAVAANGWEFPAGTTSTWTLVP